MSKVKRSHPCQLGPVLKSVVGNLFTSAAKKELWFLLRAETQTSSKGTHNIHPYYLFPLGAWWAVQELLTGHMRPVGHRLPTSELNQMQNDLASMKGTKCMVLQSQVMWSYFRQHVWLGHVSLYRGNSHINCIGETLTFSIPWQYVHSMHLLNLKT